MFVNVMTTDYIMWSFWYVASLDFQCGHFGCGSFGCNLSHFSLIFQYCAVMSVMMMNQAITG